MEAKVTEKNELQVIKSDSTLICIYQIFIIF